MVISCPRLTSTCLSRTNMLGNDGISLSLGVSSNSRTLAPAPSPPPVFSCSRCTHGEHKHNLLWFSRMWSQQRKGVCIHSPLLNGTRVGGGSGGVESGDGEMVTSGRRGRGMRRGGCDEEHGSLGCSGH